MRFLTTLLVLQLALTAFGFIRLGTVNKGSVSGRVYLIDANSIFLFEFSTTNDITISGTGASSSSTRTISGPITMWNGLTDLSGDVVDSPSIDIIESGAVIASFYVPNNVNLPCEAEYLGQFSIPNEATTLHDLDGHVFLDRTFRRFFVAGLDFDGAPPASYFWLDTQDVPTAAGIRAGYNGGYGRVLSAVDVDANVTLPPGQALTNFRTLSVWCVDFYVSFGQVDISTPLSSDPFACTNYGPSHLGYTPPSHDVAADVYVLGPNTIGLNAVSFDGNPPATWFWGTWNSTISAGFIIADSLGSLAPLTTEISGENFVITLPTGFDLCNIYYLSVYCVKAGVSFGELNLNDTFGCQWCPSSCKTNITNPLPGYQCKDINKDATAPDLRVEYNYDSTNSLITFKFHTCDLDPEQYIAFGLSGSTTGILMIGGDVVVCHYNSVEEAYCVDYYLQSQSQCAASGGTYSGACPDHLLTSGSNDYHNTQVERVNGRTTFTTTRAVTSADTHDQDFTPGSAQQTIWSRGGTFNSTTGEKWVLKHNGGYRIGSPIPIDFSATSTCTEYFQCPLTTTAPADPWTIPPLCIDSGNNEIRAYIGNTGGLQGYRAITGQDGWGIAWFLNGLLIPEVYVLRGTTVRFYVNGGVNPSNAAEYHPFYITSSSEGGIKSLADASQPISEVVYAGLATNGTSVWDLTTGGFCEWMETGGNGDNFNSWDDYKNSLNSTCNDGNSWGWFDWTTDSSSPDEAYYQCATHRLLGWKIHVVEDLDYCLQLAAGYLTKPFSCLLLIAVAITLLLYGYY